MLNCLFVGIGGFLGSICRYLIGLIPLQSEGFPVKTLVINVAGAFALGLITAFAARGRALDPKLLLMLKVGICGGFTTFSTFAFEAADLLRSGKLAAAAAYVVLSAVLGVAAAYAGQALVR